MTGHENEWDDYNIDEFDDSFTYETDNEILDQYDKVDDSFDQYDKVDNSFDQYDKVDDSLDQYEMSRFTDNIIYTSEFPAVTIDEKTDDNDASAVTQQFRAKQPESYSDISDIYTEDDQDVKRFKVTSIVKIAAVAVSAIILFIFGTISWFTMNREVENSGLQMTAEGTPFELEVKGNYIENDADFSKADSSYESGIDQHTTPTLTFRTDGGTDRIKWNKTGNTADDGHYSDGLSPSSHGKLSFWVVPNNTGDLDIEFSFSVKGFIGTYTPAANNNTEPTLNDLFEVTDSMIVTVENGLKNADDLARKKSALHFVQGHILFFSDYDSTTGYYSGFLGTGRSIRFGNCIDPSSDPKAKYNENSPVSVNEGQKYEVTVYWKWANTFEQMVLDENSPYKDNPLFPAANTTDRAAMFNYLSTTGSNSVFSGLTDSAISTNLNTVRSGVNIGSSVTALTKAYDGADQIIGNNLDYVLIEMTASQVGSN